MLTNSSMTWKGNAIGAVALFAIVVTVLLLLFDRQEQFDYESTICRSGSIDFSVDLIGTFAPGSNDRASPYYLRMQVGRDFDIRESLEIRSLKLVPRDDRESVDVSGMTHTTIKVDEIEALVLTKSDIDLIYRDYELVGEVRVGGIEQTERFSCMLIRNYSERWALPLWDAIMSV